MPDKFAVTLKTLSWYYHNKGDIERGVELYKHSKIEYVQDDPVYFRVTVPTSNDDYESVGLTFTEDGRALEDYRCGCDFKNKLYGILCPHVVAAVLAIQGGIADDSNDVPMELTFRNAEREDASLIFHLVCELAEYEKLLNRVKHNLEEFESWLFDKHAAEVVIAEINGYEVGYALYFSNFSTFLGKAGLYLEDLYIKPQVRGHGIGKAMLSHLAKIAVERDYGRMEWSCLNWNKQAIKLFDSLGAESMSDWTVYRLSGEMLEGLAEKEVSIQ